MEGGRSSRECSAVQDIPKECCRRRAWSTDGNTVEKSSEVRTGEHPLDWQFEAIHHHGQVQGSGMSRNQVGVNSKGNGRYVRTCVSVCVSSHFKTFGWQGGS